MNIRSWHLLALIAVAACSADTAERLEPWELLDPTDAARADGDSALDTDGSNDSETGVDGAPPPMDPDIAVRDAGTDPHDSAPCVEASQPLHHTDVPERCFEQNQACEISNSISNGFMCQNFTRQGNDGHCFEICYELQACVEGTRCAFHDGIWGLCFDRCEPGTCTCPPGFGCLPYADAGLCIPVNPSRQRGADCRDSSWFGCDTGLLCAAKADRPTCVPACVPGVQEHCDGKACLPITEDWGYCSDS